MLTTRPRKPSKDEGTLDDRGRDGGTNFILRVKEQETRLTLHEHDVDDDDERQDHFQFLPEDSSLLGR